MKTIKEYYAVNRDRFPFCYSDFCDCERSAGGLNWLCKKHILIGDKSLGYQCDQCARIVEEAKIMRCLCCGYDTVYERVSNIGVSCQTGWRCTECGSILIDDYPKWGFFCPDCGEKEVYFRRNASNLHMVEMACKSCGHVGAPFKDYRDALRKWRDEFFKAGGVEE